MCTSAYITAYQRLGRGGYVHKDAEIGQRGFILTGDELHLKPYTVGTAALDSVLNQLASGAEGSPLQAENVTTRRGLVAQKTSDLGQKEGVFVEYVSFTKDDG